MRLRVVGEGCHGDLDAAPVGFHAGGGIPKPSSTAADDVTMPDGWHVDWPGALSAGTISVLAPSVAWTSATPWQSPASTIITIKGVDWTVAHGSVDCRHM